jgi:PTH1 family peptidyl-tRNA hydrolase
MKLIVGLGNPGEKFQKNRHNVGHLFIDYLSDKQLPPGLTIKKTSSYMNESGAYVSRLVNENRLELTNLWIVHDDLDIKLGEYKLQLGKGPKLHKGIMSIENELDGDTFWRVRIGVDNREDGNRENGEAYVLQDFSEEELKTLNQTFFKITKDLTDRIINE